MTGEILKIGIVGLGVVGASTVKLVQQHGELLAARSGKKFEIVGVHARSKGKYRGVDLSQYEWFDDPKDLVEKCDVLIELIGGSEGIAYDLVCLALSKGVHVVTANKALVAHHGVLLAQLAESNNVQLSYEAAVAGTIPAVQAVRQAFSANKISSVYGILNGTCNFILTQMRETGRDFADILKDAQDAGYAEADPTFDIEGVDAGHKIALLAACAFGVHPDFKSVHLRGISFLTAEDFVAAAAFGYQIKLIASASVHEGRVLQSVEPCLIPNESPFAAVNGAYNAVMVAGDYADTPMLTGLGAGGDATASAVVGDIVAIARGERTATFGVPVDQMKPALSYEYDYARHSYYFRFMVEDRPGVLADVSAILRDHDISIDALQQQDGGCDSSKDVACIVMTTHQALRKNILEALSLIENLDVVQGDVCLLRIEDNL